MWVEVMAADVRYGAPGVDVTGGSWQGSGGRPHICRHMSHGITASLRTPFVMAALLLGSAACGDDSRPSTGDPDAGLPDAGPVEVPLERAHTGGAPTAVAVAGDRAYIGVGPRLAIWDLGAAGGERLLGESAPLPGVIEAVAVAGDRAYVAQRRDLQSRLHVFDVSDPAAPRETAALDLAAAGASAIADLEVGAGRLYVADREQGVIVLDLADPDAPARVRTVGTPGVSGLALVGPRLYHWGVGFTGVGIGALDVANDFADLGLANVFGVHGLAIADGDLAIGSGLDGIVVWDLADLSAPVELFRYGLPDGGPFARAVAAAGTTAWIPAQDGLHVLDLTAPGAIVRTGPLAAPTIGVNGAAVTATHLAAVTDRGRLLSFGLATPTAPTVRGVADITLCAECGAVDVAGGTAYIADVVGGLRTATLAALAPLDRSADFPQGPGAGLTMVYEDVDVEGTRAYVADWLYGLRIYDVADPAAITELGTLDTPGAPAGVAVVDGRVYLGESTGGGALRVIDAATPAQPTELGATETSKAMAIEARGDLVFVADEEVFAPGGLRIYDVRDPAAIVQRGVYGDDCSFARDVALLGDLAIVACGDSGFHLVDISNPAAPVRVAAVEPPGTAAAWSVAAWDGHVVLGHDFGVIVMRVTSANQLEQVAEYPTAYAVYGLSAPTPGRIVAACGYGGVYQWQLD